MRARKTRADVANTEGYERLMGEALREAWLWLVIAFLLGLVVGWLIRSRSVSDVGPKPVTSHVPQAAPVAAAPVAAVPVAAASSSTPLAAASVATDAKPATAKLATAKPAATKPAATKPATAKPAATPVRKPAATKPAAPLDLAAAKATLGVTVKLDDLKLIEGIGPKIESLLKADGLTTWRAVSKANLERLKGILDEAGPRYSVHNPGTWPTQAGLLADGKFAEFKKLSESLKGGK